jgi:hypothetical protein
VRSALADLALIHRGRYANSTLVSSVAFIRYRAENLGLLPVGAADPSPLRLRTRMPCAVKAKDHIFHPYQKR